MTLKTARAAATTLVAAALSGLPLSAQTSPAAPVVTTAPQAPGGIQVDSNAEGIREQLRVILERYPPSLRQVLRLDPSLLTRSDYLATYPALSAFLAQHPEIA